MERINISTKSRTVFTDITGLVNASITKHGFSNGLCHLFVPHTTAALTINEHADPDVKTDIQNKLNQLIPPDGSYRHSEGNSDAHIKASIVGSSITVSVEDGRLQLGTWQGIFFCEFDGPRNRQVWISYIAG